MSRKRSASPTMDDIHKKRGRPPNATRIAAALQTTMTLSNIEIELPDVPRPFKIVNTLPLSVDEPVYDESLGENLLSVKDSATLYNSLIISRQNWLYNDGMGIFEQYWSRREDLIEKSSHDQEDHTPVEGNDVEVTAHHEGTSKRKNMSKLCECSLQLGPHSFDIRLFIVKNDKIEKKFDDDQREEEKKTGIKVKREDGDNDESDKEGDDEEDTNKEGTTEAKETPKPETELGSGLKIDSGNLEKDKTEKQKTPKSKPQVKPKPPKELKFTSQTTDNGQKKIETIAGSSKPSSAESKPVKREIQQSLENHIMIANLNSLARTNTSLNDLMKIVASGNANTKQITEFQKYIIQAKDMGDPSGNHAKTYYLQQKLQKLELRQAEKQLKNEEKLKQLIERQKIKELKRELRRIEKEKEKELKQEAKQQRRLMRQKEREVTQDKKKRDPSFKINKTKLTALQERYLENATLAFEFSENSSSRYLLPKDCIMEKLENGELLMSFVTIHNHLEIAEFELEEEAELLRILKEEEVKSEAEPSPDVTEPARKPARRKKSRFGPIRKLSTRTTVKEPEPLPKRERPQPVYSTVTIKLLEVPPHCHQLILNSADALEEVQLKMNRIFDEGLRQEANYVWYQLDGIHDEVQAEVLRSNLKTLEAQNVKRAGGTGRRKATE